MELCPFAGPVLRDNSLRIEVCDAADTEGQLRAFLRELDRLQHAGESALSTTLLVLENGPRGFEEFLALVEAADALLDDAGLRGVIQLAHFHPDYRFAGEPENALSHYTNRSPLPTIHLLREAMLSRLLAAYPDPENIPVRNIARLEALGRGRVEARWRMLCGRQSAGHRGSSQ
jgi:hypothetical protein